MMFRILFALALVAGTASADDAFVAGNQAAMHGDAKAAAAAFERAPRWSAATQFDLGNAYASSGDRGHAILAYERAQVLAPRDGAIAQNLARARAEAGVAEPAPGPLARAPLASNDWAYVALAGVVFACAGIVALGWAWRRRAAVIVLVAGAVVATGAVLAAARTAPSRDRAIVLARTEAHIAPAANADAVFTAPAGEAVTIAQRHGEFVEVRDGQRSGWLPAASVERVIR
jgi:tetratricopeptide (TPR) repeat protein